MVVRDARVAADATFDLREPAGPGLRRELRIGDERARHSDGLGATLRDHAIRKDRVDDARRRDSRQDAGELLCPFDDRAVADGRRRDDADRSEIRRRVAEGERHVVDAE